MRTIARTVYPYLAALFVAGVVIQFFLAGVAVFGLQGDLSTAGSALTDASFDQRFGAHLTLGDVLALAPLLLVAVALVARLGRRSILSALGLLAVVWVQATIAFAGPPIVRGLHPVLGLLVLFVGIYVALDAFRAARSGWRS
jgi:hypothetical protein